MGTQESMHACYGGCDLAVLHTFESLVMIISGSCSVLCGLSTFSLSRANGLALRLAAGITTLA